MSFPLVHKAHTGTLSCSCLHVSWDKNRYQAIQKNKLLIIICCPLNLCSSFTQTKLLTQYVLNLAKYDQNYDIRDRARFIRQLIVPTEKSGALSKYAKKLFLALKPAPVLESPFKGTEGMNGITKK